MTEKEQAVIDMLCGEAQKPWTYCDASCSTCKFYHEESDMGARVSICAYGLGKGKDSCHYYMTRHEYFELVRSVFANLKAENAKLREELGQWERLTANIELPTYPVTEFQPKDLERENAMLREQLEYDRQTSRSRLESIDHLKAENAKLRESIDHLKAENAKLRELVSVMAYCNQFRRDCDGCSMNGADGIITERAGCDELLARLRELGVEVKL